MESRLNRVGDCVRVALHVLVALTFAAIAFVIGVYLPLCIYWFFHGDPGMPGGAGLVLIGFPVGVIGGLSVGVFTFLKLLGRHIQRIPT